MNKEEIDYAITGAVAASYYGIPRTTLDVDFVVHVSPQETSRFVKRLRGVDIDADVARIRRQLKSGYNVITVADRLSPYTADLIFSRDRPERRRGSVRGVETFFQSPESLILAKLRMIKATVQKERSQNDRDDIRAILANTKVNRRRITEVARRESSLRIFRELAKQGPRYRTVKRSKKLSQR